MKDKDIQEAISTCIAQAISSHGQQLHNIFVFGCPNCGHSVAATEVKINTGRMLKTYPFMYSDKPFEYPEIISCNQCLTCGKKFEKFPPEWKEWKG